MPNDLPAAIRTALHSNDIDEADLHRPTFSEPAPRRTGAMLAVAAAVVAVAVLAGALALPSHHADHRTSTGGSVGYVGYRWTVVRVVDRHGALPVPAALHARIGYTPDGQVIGNDGFNALSGRRTAVEGGYTVRDASTTLVGGTSPGSLRARVAAAVDATFFSSHGRKVVRVAAVQDGNRLTLHTASCTLVLRRAGLQGDPGGAAPSATPTAG